MSAVHCALYKYKTIQKRDYFKLNVKVKACANITDGDASSIKNKFFPYDKQLATTY